MLEPGQKIGTYEIAERIGAGGMGEVYRAHDAKLKRDVAIKSLPASFALDSERVSRIEREARLLASLNHPNIATIHGLEEHAGHTLLVLELVDGVTLDELIQGGAIPIDQTLDLARQIADALEAAHEKGVIHRDLKPANIKLTSTGLIKVLDFGLAKAFAPDGREPQQARASTVSIHETRRGVVLGTAPYMSPEQARGESVDRRTDIWAFGCVLYEMLTGIVAFGYGSATEVLARILEREPDLDCLPSSAPEPVRRLLARCLEKNPKNRLQHIGDARLDLREAESYAPPVRAAAGHSRRRFVLAAGTATASVVTGAGGTWWWTAASSRRGLPIDAPEGERHDERETPGAAISRQGSAIFFVTHDKNGTAYLNRKLLTEATSSRIPISDAPENRIRDFVLSPDGRSIGFFSGAVFKYMVSSGGSLSVGGPDEIFGTDPATGRVQSIYGMEWTEDDRIVFGNIVPSGLWEFSIDSKEPAKEISSLKPGERNHAWPHVLPDGKVLFTVLQDGGMTSARLALLDIDSGEHRELNNINGTHPRYSRTGHLVYGHLGSIWAVGFNYKTGELRGSPVELIDGVRTTQSGFAAFDISEDGTLIYLDGGMIEHGALVKCFEPMGKTVKLPSILGRDYYLCVRASPMSDLLALQIQDIETRHENIYYLDLAGGGPLQPLTSDTRVNATPLWHPAEASLVFASNREGDDRWGLYWADTARPNDVPLELTVRPDTARLMPMGWGPDQNTLIYMEEKARAANVSGESADIRILRRVGENEWRDDGAWLQTDSGEGWGSTSPDGVWISYASPIEAGWQIYAGPFADASQRKKLTSDGGYYPLWSNQGPEIYYYLRDVRSLMAIDLSIQGNRVDPTEPRLVVEGPPLPTPSPPRPFDQMRDGNIVTLMTSHGKEGPQDSPMLWELRDWTSRLHDIG
jgi:serine/threonine protein kinase